MSISGGPNDGTLRTNRSTRTREKYTVFAFVSCLCVKHIPRIPFTHDPRRALRTAVPDKRCFEHKTRVDFVPIASDKCDTRRRSMGRPWWANGNGSNWLFIWITFGQSVIGSYSNLDLVVIYDRYDWFHDLLFGSANRWCKLPSNTTGIEKITYKNYNKCWFVVLLIICKIVVSSVSWLHLHIFLNVLILKHNIYK